MMLADPSLRQNDLAKHFGLSATWISIMINSDAFKERMRERKAELVDPVLKATLDEKILGVANRAFDKLAERLDNPAANIKTQDLIQIAKLGAPERPKTPPAAPNLYVVQLPAPAQTTQSWLENSSARAKLPLVEEIHQNG